MMVVVIAVVVMMATKEYTAVAPAIGKHDGDEVVKRMDTLRDARRQASIPTMF